MTGVQGGCFSHVQPVIMSLLPHEKAVEIGWNFIEYTSCCQVRSLGYKFVAYCSILERR